MTLREQFPNCSPEPPDSKSLHRSPGPEARGRAVRCTEVLQETALKDSLGKEGGDVQVALGSRAEGEDLSRPKMGGALCQESLSLTIHSSAQWARLNGLLAASQPGRDPARGTVCKVLGGTECPSGLRPML